VDCEPCPGRDGNRFLLQPDCLKTVAAGVHPSGDATQARTTALPLCPQAPALPQALAVLPLAVPWFHAPQRGGPENRTALFLRPWLERLSSPARSARCLPAPVLAALAPSRIG